MTLHCGGEGQCLLECCLPLRPCVPVLLLLGRAIGYAASRAGYDVFPRAKRAVCTVHNRRVGRRGMHATGAPGLAT